MLEKPRYPNAGLYVTPSGTSAFEKNFRSLLISALVEEQVRVTNQQGNHMLLSFELDMLKHNKRMMVTESGRYHALGPDLVVRRAPACFPECSGEREYYPRMEVEAVTFTREMPRSEIVIITSLIYNSNYKIYENITLCSAQDVKSIQKRFKELGLYEYALDGIWGKRSKKALEYFKKAHGLDNYSQWDLETQKKLFAQSG